MAWNQSTGPTKVEPKKPSAMKGVVAGVVCVAIAAAVAFFVLSGKDEKPKAKEGTKSVAIKESVPKLVAAPERVVQEKNDSKTFLSDSVVQSVTEPKPQETNETLMTAAERRRRRPRPVFDNQADQLIAMVMSAPPGTELPPLPITPSLEADFKKAIKRPIVINPDDSDEVKAMKQAVQETRLEIQALIEERGATVASILSEHQDLVRENAHIRTDIVKEASEIRRQYGEAEAQKYLNKMNLCLQQMGIQEVRQTQTLSDFKQKIMERKNKK